MTAIAISKTVSKKSIAIGSAIIFAAMNQIIGFGFGSYFATKNSAPTSNIDQQHSSQVIATKQVALLGMLPSEAKIQEFSLQAVKASKALSAQAWDTELEAASVYFTDYVGKELSRYVSSSDEFAPLRESRAGKVRVEVVPGFPILAKTSVKEGMIQWHTQSKVVFFLENEGMAEPIQKEKLIELTLSQVEKTRTRPSGLIVTEYVEKNL